MLRCVVLFMLSRPKRVSGFGAPVNHCKTRPICLLLWLVLCTDTQADPDILVLNSHQSAPYEQTLQGFQHKLEDSGLSPHYQVINRVSRKGVDSVKKHLSNFSPQLIFTLGTPATQAALSLPQRPPIVAALIFSAAELAQQKNITAVTLAQPAVVQWRFFRQLLPAAQNVAVLYNPAISQATFQALQKRAKHSNIRLIAIPVRHSNELPLAIRRLSTQLDAFWVLDASLFNSAAVRQLLLFSFRNRIPLIGLSVHWVKAGALYALDWDYYDIGAQAAELALKILQQHKQASDLAPRAPRKARPVYNPKTADYMKLELKTKVRQTLLEVRP